MSLQVVKDTKTLTLFLEEMSILWEIAEHEMFNATTPEIRHFHRQECVMYSDLCLAIADEAILLAQ